MRDFLKVAERKEDIKVLDNSFNIDAKDKYFNYVDSLSESELREEYRNEFIVGSKMFKKTSVFGLFE